MSTTRRAWPFSAIALLAFGTALIGVGFFFAILRPSLLPEDMRFVGLTLTQLQTEQPRMATWLLHVFRVLGGYAAASGILTVTIAATAFRRHDPIAGLGAVIDSDFKGLLLGIALLWACSMVLFWVERRAAVATAGR
jgi:hypothetical protein